jgi:hypothetical protein
MMREQEILEKRREEESVAGGSGGAGKAAAGGGEAREGEGEGTGEAQGEAEEGEGGREGNGTPSTTARGTGGSPDEPAGEPIESGGGTPEETSETESGRISNGRIPPDVGNGEDDDIVARQLREAAMKEEDPELREKLWDEYRAYKFGEKKKKKDTGGESEGSW